LPVFRANLEARRQKVVAILADDLVPATIIAMDFRKRLLFTGRVKQHSSAVLVNGRGNTGEIACL
jgi:hypothetical protein